MTAAARLLPAVVQSVDPAVCTAMVRLPSIDGELHGPAPYTPIALGDGDTTIVHHPKRGARGLVVEDVDDGMWLAQWDLLSR